MKQHSDGRMLGNPMMRVIQNTPSRLKHLGRHRSSSSLLKIMLLEKENPRVMGKVNIVVSVSFLGLIFRNFSISNN